MKLLKTAVCVAAVLSSGPLFGQTTFFWDADGTSSPAAGGTGNWDTSSVLWRRGTNTGTLSAWVNSGLSSASFGAPAGTITLSSAIFARDVSWSSSGTTIIDASVQSITAFGNVSITSGTLQVGTTNSTVGYVVPLQALRSDAVNVASGASLTTGAANGPVSGSDLVIGALSGGGAVVPGNSRSVTIVARGNATFSGSLTGVNLFLHGANGTTETFTGDLTALAGNATVSTGATLVLSGTGSTAGVTGTTGLTLQGGSIVLDNTGGNTSAGAGRVSDTASITGGGGTLSLLGNSAGTTEAVGFFTMSTGATTISVTNNGGTGAALVFSNFGSIRNSTQGTLNFVGQGTGTLGAAGNNPRITFSGLTTNTTNGALANTSSATALTIGWARVNGTNWAGVGANGVVALAETARDSSALPSAAAWEVTTFTPSTTTTTLSANLGTNTTPLLLKLTPSASGQSLDGGTFDINAVGVILAGTTDFMIAGSGNFFGTVAAPHYVYVTDSNTVLSVSESLAGSNQTINKAGAGTLSLTGTGGSSQLLFSSATNINVLEGALRGTATSLTGSTSIGGQYTSLNLGGGVLEYSGGGTFTRAFNVTPTSTGGSLQWLPNSDGGFSAINGAATITLVTALAGSTLAAPTWGTTSGFLSDGSALVFGSNHSDSLITLGNSIGLDAGGTSNSYSAREVRVIDNPNSSGDSARLSGVISGSAFSDFMKTGPGKLELTGANTYAGNTLVVQGTLSAGNASALGTGAVQVTGGTLMSTVPSLSIGGEYFQSSGALNLGNAGTLAMASSKNFTMIGGTLNLALGSSFSKIAGGGSGVFSISGGTVAFDTTGAGFSYGSTYQVASGFASYSVSGVSFSGYDAANYAASLSNAGVVSFSAIPEPSTYAAILGVAVLGRAVRRTRARG